MLSKPIVAAVLAATCVAAAAGGAYLAVRHNATSGSAGGGATVSADPALTSAEAFGEPNVPIAVEATEAVLEEAGESTDAPEIAPTTASNTRATTNEAAGSAEAPARPVREAPARVSEAPDTARADQPDPVPAEDWVGLDEPWPSREAEPLPEVPLTPVDSSWYGTTLEPEEPLPIFEELVISADSVIGLQIETSVTSEQAEVEDDVEARVTRDVAVGERIAIPAGTRMLGSVVLVERGGKVKERARLGIRFHTVVLADSTQLPVVTETVYREGEAPGGESAAKIGSAAVGGAILGAILGGAKGAVLGGSAGAAGGTAAVMAGDRNPATLPAGSTLTVRLSQPATVTIER